MIRDPVKKRHAARIQRAHVTRWREVSYATAAPNLVRGAILGFLEEIMSPTVLRRLN
jgi:hypothetical protein